MTDNIDINDVKILETGNVRTSTGKFVKGVSGNLKGRPKKIKPAEIISKAEDLNTIDPTIFGTEAKKALEYLLSTSKNRTEVKQLATILAPYQTPKKASIETTIKEYNKIEFRMIAPESMAQLEEIYKKDPKLVEQLDSNKINEITNGKPIEIEVDYERMVEETEE